VNHPLLGRARIGSRESETLAMAARRNCTFRAAGVLSGNDSVSYFGFDLHLYPLADRMSRLVELG
jgi:hypothetical protein